MIEGTEKAQTPAGLGRSARVLSNLEKEVGPVITDQNTITQETRQRLPYAELGAIMLRECGAEACQRGYQTTEPEWVGRSALQYGDINPDGTLN